MGHTTRTEDIYRKLKDLIVTSQLLPGTPLQENGLCDLLNVSRTPIREALRLLEAEGLVESQPHRGARVALLSRQDVLDAYEARAWVEPAIAAKAARIIDAETVGRLKEAAERMPEDPLTHDEAALAQSADQDFHHLLAQAAGNHLAQLLVRDAQAITRRAAYFVPPGRYRKSKEEHCTIVRALEAHDAEEAREQMLLHITNAQSRMIGGE